MVDTVQAVAVSIITIITVTAILITLRIIGIITWGWTWVLAPLWISCCAVLVYFTGIGCMIWWMIRND